MSKHNPPSPPLTTPHHHRPLTTTTSATLHITTDACAGNDTEVNYLEHVQAVVTLTAGRRGDVELFLTSPMGTRWVRLG